MIESFLMAAFWTVLAALITFGALALIIHLLLMQKKYKG